jgi:hypothetical protein
MTPSTKLGEKLEGVDNFRAWKYIVMLVIAHVVGWENLDPTTKESATTRESYTQCHLDVGPARKGD